MGMKGKLLIGTAVATYLAVVGCVVWPGGSASRPQGYDSYPSRAPQVKLEGLPLRGIAMQVQSPQNLDDYLKGVDQIAATGADTVEFVVSARMEHGRSSRIFIDQRSSPSRAQLEQLIDRAKQNKLRIMLMPIVLLEAPRGNEWRGTISPESEAGSAWDTWFESYQNMLRYYAEIAEKGKVELFVVGSELVSTEAHAAEWGRTIGMVRTVYHGMLTYSSNWDHYESIPFWEQLDIIGMNSYWKLGGKNAQVDEIVGRWRDIQKDLMAFSNRKNKPILLTEVGWCSMGNAPYEPWDYTKAEEPLDLDVQKRLYQGFFQSWYGNPNMAGFMIWEWEPFSDGGPQNRSYTPKAKPAEKVLRDYLEKGPWEVKY